MKTLKKKPAQMPAKKRGVVKAELALESIENCLPTFPVKEDPAIGLVGLGSSSGKGGVSARHDKYLVKYAKTRRT